MKFYNKYYKNNYEELITYYPRFYRDVFEMVEILKAHGRIADGMEENIEQAFLNGFIDYADEATIEKLEKFLEIGLNRSRTLEERRRLVKSYFVGFGKLSASLICKMIGAYTNAPVSCRFEPFDEEGNNLLYIDFQRSGNETIYMSDILTLLSKKLPAHIAYRPELVYRFPVVIGRRRTYYRYGYDFCGTKPDTSLLGIAIKRDTVTQEEHSNTRLTYKNASEKNELAGTKPDITLLAAAYESALAVEEHRENTLTEYEAAGTKPEAAAVARKLGQIAAISQRIGNFTTDYEKAAETAHTGAEPGITTVGDTNVIDAATGATATEYSVNYTPCGTTFTQS